VIDACRRLKGNEGVAPAAIPQLSEHDLGLTDSTSAGRSYVAIFGELQPAAQREVDLLA
jgi:hypothetical protein